jgi:hypothetical protein
MMAPAPRNQACLETLLILGLLVLLGTDLVDMALGKGLGARAGYGLIYLAIISLVTLRIACLRVLVNTAPMLALLLLLP